MERLNPLTETETKTVKSRYSRGDWEILECLETGMVFMANPPDYSRLEDEFAWEKTYAEETARRRTLEPAFYSVSLAIKKIRRAIKKRNKISVLTALVLDQLPPGKWLPLQMLDVGCGDGDKLFRIVSEYASGAKRALTPVGIEVSKGLATEAHARLGQVGGKCIHGAALAGLQEIEDGSIHCAILCSFLEHETNPLPLLRALIKKLVEGGGVVIKVPNFACLNRMLRGQRWCGFRYPEHVNYFTPRTLKDMLRRAGYTLKRMNFWDTFPTSDNMYAVAGK